jgi:hypothetical protein
MFSDFGKSCLKNKDTSLHVIADYVLRNSKAESIDFETLEEKITGAINDGLSTFFISKFDTFLSVKNADLINEKGELSDPKKWKPVSIGDCLVGKDNIKKRYFLAGDTLSSPWFKFGLGLSDGFGHVDAYFDNDADNNSIIKSEHKLTLRQIHIINSLMVVRKEFHENFPKVIQDLL